MSEQKVVTIYSTSSCTWCKRAKQFLDEHNIAYVEFDVGTDRTVREGMIQKSGQMGVPVITINDEVVIGFNEPLLKEKLGLISDLG